MSICLTFPGLDKVPGSLTLGGYDVSKYTSNELTFPFATGGRDLTLNLTAISSDANATASLLPTEIPVFLDSTLPYLWLPVEACTAFEEAFHLTWDDETELYLLADSTHEALLSTNPNITFTLSGSSQGGVATITLPYAAFDLTASPPLVANATKYFPLKRAMNSSQYTLGRVFFQEA